MTQGLTQRPEQREPLRQAGRAAARGGWPLQTLLIGLAAHLVSPILFSQHLEGYTINLRSIALVWDQGRLADIDTIAPVIIHYLFATRSGIILLLAATCVIGFIAMTGLVDVGCFFNENIISAALGVAALAVVSRSGAISTCAASGVLLGADALRGEAKMGDIHVVPLSRPGLESIKASADRIMADFNVDGEPRPFTYEDFKALYRAHP